MIISNNFSALLPFIQTQGYWIILFLMIIEGPIITSVSSFAASLGYFNIWFIFLLAIMGDVIGDAIHYYIGHVGRTRLIDKYEHIFKIKKSIMKRISNHYHNHLGKTLFLVKMTPLATPGLLLAGASKVPIKKYAFYCMLIIIPRAVIFTAIGYLFGAGAAAIFKVYSRAEHVLLVLIAVIIIAYFLNKLVSDYIYKKI